MCLSALIIQYTVEKDKKNTRYRGTKNGFYNITGNKRKADADKRESAGSRPHGLPEMAVILPRGAF